MGFPLSDMLARNFLSGAYRQDANFSLAYFISIIKHKLAERIHILSAKPSGYGVDWNRFAIKQSRKPLTDSKAMAWFYHL